MQVSYVSRFIDYSVLDFPDQYSENGYLGSQTNQPINSDNVRYVDFTSGGIFYTNNYWIGLAYAHMSQPDQSFLTGGSRLPYKLDFTTGYRIDIEKKNTTKQVDQGRDIYFTPTLHYKAQGRSDQFDLGVYFLYDQLITGVWYRGLPLLKQYRRGLQNNESIVGIIGWKINRAKHQL